MTPSAVLLTAAVAILASFLPAGAAAGDTEAEETDFQWTHSLVLDKEGKFVVRWRPEDKRIVMQIEVRGSNEFKITQ